MIYVVFTDTGLERALDALEPMDGLWLNPGLVDAAERDRLGDQFASVNVLPEEVDPRREADIVAAVEVIERLHPEAELMVEYP